MAIRILHVIETMLGMGGMEKGVVNLIGRLDPNRFEHVVCVIRSLGVLSDSIPRNRVKLLCLDQTASGFIFLAPTFVRVIREFKPDIVHSRNRGAFEAVLAGYWTGASALVHSEHGVESVDSSRELWRRRQLRRLIFGLADQVCTVSNHLRDYHSLHTGFPPQRIKVIHNGVDTSRFQPRLSAREGVRQRLGVSPDEFLIGAVGRLESVKDITTLLRAVAEMPVSPGGCRVLIAGDGGEMQPLRDLAQSRPELRTRVQFLGEIQDIPDFLNALDVYVLPSVYEGICNSLLEAMASGLAVIATATGGNPEVVVDGESGILFPVGDVFALARLLDRLRQQEVLRTQLGQYAVQRIHDHFSLESMVTSYEELYSGLAATSSRRRERRSSLATGGGAAEPSSITRIES